MARKKEPRECPNCCSIKIIPILYGMPDAAAGEMDRAGKLKIGGCCISDDSPNWHCRTCEHEWLAPPGPWETAGMESLEDE